MIKQVSGHPEWQQVDFHEVLDPDRSGYDPVKAEKAKELLENIHAGPYQKAIPHPDEQEEVEQWIVMLENPGKIEPRTFISVMGKNLDDPEKVNCLICMVSEYYTDANAGLPTYLFGSEGRHPHSFRWMSNYHVKLLEKAAQEAGKAPLAGIFAEINDPEKTPYDPKNPDPMVDCMDPRRRERMAKRWLSEINIDYVQPPLSKEQPPCDVMNLYSVPRSDGSVEVTPQALRKFVTTYYKVLRGNITEGEMNDLAIQRMFKQIDAIERGERHLFAEDAPKGFKEKGAAPLGKAERRHEFNPSHL